MKYNYFDEGMVKNAGLMITLPMLHLLCPFSQALIEIVRYVKWFYPCEMHEKFDMILV